MAHMEQIVPALGGFAKSGTHSRHLVVSINSSVELAVGRRILPVDAKHPKP